MHGRTDAGQMATATAGADAVEIKTMVAASDEARARSILGLDRARPERRRLFFYDTRGLELEAVGVVLRAREVGSARVDSTVKIRAVDPARVDGPWRTHRGFKIEADVVGEAVVRAASLTVARGRDEIEAVARGERAIAALFSREQEAFLLAMAPRAIAFPELVPLGPVLAHRWRVAHPGLPYRVCAEAWRLPDGGALLELSIKTRPEEAAAAITGFAGFLRELGVAAAIGQTKTRATLAQFADQARA